MTMGKGVKKSSFVRKPLSAALPNNIRCRYDSCYIVIPGKAGTFWIQITVFVCLCRHDPLLSSALSILLLIRCADRAATSDFTCFV